MNLSELTSKVCNAIGFKVNQFTFPVKKDMKDSPPGDSAFYIDDVVNGKRFWFHITESKIPQGTNLLLSETDDNVWKENALKHMKVKTKKVRTPGATKSRTRVVELI